MYIKKILKKIDPAILLKNKEENKKKKKKDGQ